MQTPESFLPEEIVDARAQDVVAKLSGVSLANTIRVLRALDIVAEFTVGNADDIVRTELVYDKPTEEQAAACERAYEYIKRKAGELATDRVKQLQSIAS